LTAASDVNAARARRQAPRAAFTRLPPATGPLPIAAEGERLLAFIAPDAGDPRVRFDPPLRRRR